MSGPRRLKEWLSRHSAKDEAERLGVAPETMSRWANGRSKPSLLARWAIAALTGGIVYVNAWDKP